jgi:ribonucleoside-diphosphate reductase alpha chain|tara:strand:- start:4885 stop:6789 length:1905 start_codon:yes stop_codon:yes gene_type:complete
MTNHLPTLYQQYIHLSRYSRWDKNEERRESYEETVSRYFDFFEEHTGQDIVTPELRRYLEDKVLGLGVMPSMRCLMTAGPALKRENVAGYNCSYLPVDHPRAFDECLYILMNGTGVGFSVERDYINKLPAVSETLEYSDSVINVGDSKEGWARGLRELIGSLYQGSIPQWNMDKIRPAGALLKVFGGRASGPEPLEDLFRFTVDTFKDAAGRKLTSLQCHDIMCKIGDVVVVGGVRRSALISLSNLSDMRMRNAKAGEWYKANPQRALANNSVCYTEKPDNIGVFMEEWLALYMSKNGERGIFNRQAAKDHVRKIGRRDPDHDFGTNPCSEIILRPNQFCNLTEVVCRLSDTKETLMDKIKAATILGTIQSTLTNFKYLRKIWTKNTEEERLLGVSLTGILDCPLLTEENPNLEELLNDLREYAVKVNREYADLLGINPSASITCVKPSGTVSQLVDSASGIHARHSPHYIRTVRSDIKDPLTTFMINSGFPNEVDLGNSQNVIFSFPVAAPENAICRTDKTALQQLRFWKIYATTWCEHKPSITVSIKEHEWLEVGAWLHKNFHYLSGIAFLPFDDHVYQQAPYTDINQQQYKEMLMTMPTDIDWTGLATYEQEDNTIASQELACVGGVCEIF